jgi:hypothetical protein
MNQEQSDLGVSRVMGASPQVEILHQVYSTWLTV